MEKRFRTKVKTHSSFGLFAICLLGISLTPWQAAFAQDSIDLAWAYEQTLINNNQLKAYPYELRIAEADKIQAGVNRTLESVLK